MDSGFFADSDPDFINPDPDFINPDPDPSLLKKYYLYCMLANIWSLYNNLKGINYFFIVLFFKEPGLGPDFSEPDPDFFPDPDPNLDSGRKARSGSEKKTWIRKTELNNNSCKGTLCLGTNCSGTFL